MIRRLMRGNGVWRLATGLALLGVSVVMLIPQRELIRLAAQGYVFGYPLVMMDITKTTFINNNFQPNQLINVPRFPDASFQDVVRPNVDTLYSVAWLELTREPLVLEIPATDRYYVLQLLDGWTNVSASLGPRTSGRDAGRFLIAGPSWSGEPPADLTLLRSPTAIAWLLGRVQANGVADYANLHRIQQQLHLTPFSQWQAGIQTIAKTATINTRQSPPPLLQMKALDATAFFTRLHQLLQDNPAQAQDKQAVAGLAELGLYPDRPMPAWSTFQTTMIRLGMRLAERKLQQALNAPDGLDAGWRKPPINIGSYAQDYGLRAAVAMVGLGANLPEDAVYFNAHQDQDGRPLQGGRHYRLHFAADKLPPVKAFWSLTVYDDDGFLIANPLGRYALGDRDPLHFNPDGSLDITLRADAPANGAENWLPIPASDNFSITARLYWPQTEALSGEWRMPGIRPVDI